MIVYPLGIFLLFFCLVVILDRLAPQPSLLEESLGSLPMSVSNLQRLQAGEVVDIKTMSHIMNCQLLNIVSVVGPSSRVLSTLWKVLDSLRTRRLTFTCTRIA